MYKIKQQAYPDPLFAPIPPANPAGDQTEIDRNAAAQAAIQVIGNAVNERNFYERNA